MDYLPSSNPEELSVFNVHLPRLVESNAYRAVVYSGTALAKEVSRRGKKVKAQMGKFFWDVVIPELVFLS